MTIYIDPEYVTRLEDEKNKQDEYIQQLNNDLKIKNNIIKNTLTIDRQATEKLKEEKEELKQELFNLYLKHYN